MVVMVVVVMVNDGFRLRLASEDFFESICSCSLLAFVAAVIPSYSLHEFQISAARERVLRRDDEPSSLTKYISNSPSLLSWCLFL
jgi:hypothetical protein